MASRPHCATLQASLDLLAAVGAAGVARDAFFAVFNAGPVLDADNSFDFPVEPRVWGAGAMTGRLGLEGCRGEEELLPAVRSGVLLLGGEGGRDFGLKMP
jgi:hypothetical protein